MKRLWIVRALLSALAAMILCIPFPTLLEYGVPFCRNRSWVGLIFIAPFIGWVIRWTNDTTRYRGLPWIAVGTTLLAVCLAPSFYVAGPAIAHVFGFPQAQIDAGFSKLTGVQPRTLSSKESQETQDLQEDIDDSGPVERVFSCLFLLIGLILVRTIDLKYLPFIAFSMVIAWHIVAFDRPPAVVSQTDKKGWRRFIVRMLSIIGVGILGLTILGTFLYRQALRPPTHLDSGERQDIRDTLRKARRHSPETEAFFKNFTQHFGDDGHLSYVELQALEDADLLLKSSRLKPGELEKFVREHDEALHPISPEDKVLHRINESSSSSPRSSRRNFPPN